MKKIDKQMVVAGLKYLTENQEVSNQELYDHLKEMGWNFSWEDFDFQFPCVKIFRLGLFDGIKKGSLWAGAELLVNLSAGNPITFCFRRDYISEQFLTKDGDVSVYHLIRKLTGDETYTKASLGLESDTND